MSDTSEQEVSSIKKRKSIIFPVLWRVAVLTVGINMLTSLFTATPMSPVSLDSLAARTFALGFKAADYAIQQDKVAPPDYVQLSKKYKLSEKQMKRFFLVRSSNNSELFTHYEAVDKMSKYAIPNYGGYWDKVWNHKYDIHWDKGRVYRSKEKNKRTLKLELPSVLSG